MARRLLSLATLATLLASGVAGCGEPAYRFQPQGAAETKLVAPSLETTVGTRDASPSAAEVVRPLWSFHAGAPLQAGAGASTAGVAVGSGDGYLHALREDGAYRWSYTLRGAIIAPPLLDDKGSIYVVTAARRLYALTAQGTLGFSMPLAGRPLAPVRWASDGMILIATAEGLVYAITAGGAMHTAMALREPLSAAPLPLEGGKWLVGGERGSLFEVEGWRSAAKKLSTDPVSALVQGEGSFLALAGGRLIGADAGENTGISAIGCGGEESVVIAQDGRVGRVVSGQVVWLAKIEALPSAAPVCTRDGRILLPLPSGELVVVSAQGRAVRYAVAHSMLFSPIVDERLAQVLVSAAEGRTVALPLGAL